MTTISSTTFRAVLFLILSLAAAAAQSDIKKIRINADDEMTRVVFELSRDVQHTSFSLDQPHRAVIDFHQNVQPLSADYNGGIVQGIRFGMRKQGLRAVIDLDEAASPLSYTLAPADGYGYRLVVDLKHEGSKHPTASTRTHNKEIIVVIDPGHGGADPGAVGPNKLQEKQVTLQVARRLARLLNKEPGMRAVLTRNDDRYLKLRQRRDIARRHDADLFVSIHADAFKDRRVQGSSVYILSERGASSEHARMLADRENMADLVGEIALQGKDDNLASVILDISQNAAIEASMNAGQKILSNLGGLGRLHKSDVQRAGFAVLKSPDVPSILVETAFISNPTEERRLKDGNYQEKLALKLRDGIRAYFKEYRPQQIAKRH